jgi:hypothetical protein
MKQKLFTRYPHPPQYSILTVLLIINREVWKDRRTTLRKNTFEMVLFRTMKETSSCLKLECEFPCQKLNRIKHIGDLFIAGPNFNYLFSGVTVCRAVRESTPYNNNAVLYN